ncbi:hypothetical protein [Sorangium sp. So ce1078]|uniref:hypothetical protein n=1 Tax=Sorangium sp. So ce1078 TaxID=3133329 RepID=UPI003F627E4A
MAPSSAAEPLPRQLERAGVVRDVAEEALAARLDTLTPRKREVYDRVARGDGGGRWVRA